jgi:hypothetical protein
MFSQIFKLLPVAASPVSKAQLVDSTLAINERQPEVLLPAQYSTTLNPLADPFTGLAT